MEPLAKLSFKDGYGKGLGWREINARPPLQRQAMVPNWQDYGSSLRQQQQESERGAQIEGSTDKDRETTAAAIG